jgi:pimeloyl-ACP methyl ester carboxylesterase
MIRLMPKAPSNGIELEYDDFGSSSDPPLLLIMGFSAQMIAWDDRFCGLLADEGFHVIRFDNRDVGLSSRVPEPAYTLDDMAADAAGLLDHLGIAAAHIVGASMGGMIAQLFAIRHPQKTLSLCSIMSTTGNPEVGAPTPEAISALLQPRPTTREEAIARGEEVGRIIGSKTLFDAEKAKRNAALAFDRANDPDGILRQMQAIQAQTAREADLAKVTMPTLVIHGRHDPLVTVSGGEATAKAIPGAQLLVLDEMGHDLPEPLWPEIVGAITKNARSAT